MTSPSGSLGIGTESPGLRVVDSDDGPAVFVDGGYAVAAVAREPRELNVPIGRLDVFVLSGRQLVPLHAGEFAPGVGQVIEPF